MPILASFDGIHRFVNFMLVVFAIWASSGVAALIAFALAFDGRTRRASRGFAIASMIGSIPISVFAAFGVSFGVSGPFLLLTCAPWIVGTGVLYLDHHLSKIDGEN